MDLIQLTQNGSALVLQGEGRLPPFSGASWTAGTGGGTGEQLTVMLGGSADEIEAGITALNRLLDEAARWAPLPGADWVYLEARSAPGGDLWRSKLTGGWIELLGAGADQRAGGSQGLRLHLQRADWWEGPQVELPTSSAQEARSTLPKILSNAPGGNYLHLDGADIGGDLPAPLLLRLDAAVVGVGGADALAAQNVFCDPAGLGIVYQGEAGSVLAGSLQPDHAALSWSGSAETALWSVALSAAELQKMGGRAFRPLLGLRSPLSGGAIWQRWDLQYEYGRSGVWMTVWRSECAYQPEGGSGAQLALGPLCTLPPWYIDPGAASSENMRLRLLAAGELEGAHSLELDFLELLPLDGWRYYTRLLPVVNPSIVDDPVRGVIYPGLEGVLQQHTAEGPGLAAYPGRAARIYLHLAAASGYNPAQAITVSLAYRPRKRTL